jgi:serine/threonine protein phosphatase 1
MKPRLRNRTPEGRALHSGRVFVIGDIHGCPVELEAMLDAIRPTAQDTVVFLGDYVDRGPGAREVLQRLIDFKDAPGEKVFLKGNHEDMMLSFLGFSGRYGESYLLNGGFNTLQSYGGQDIRAATERIPSVHLEFVRTLKPYELRPPYLFVHAGIRPSRTWEQQDEEDMLWIRHEFILESHQLGYTVIFGHTPMKNVMVDLPYKIGLDTGLVYGGKLSCVELAEGLLYQVSRGSREVKIGRLAAG